MVLRKPYAFLIKYFRLIHLIITALLGYLVYRAGNIYKYLNTVIASSTSRYGAPEFIRYGLIIVIILALALFFAIYWLLKYKDKPTRLYIVSMAGYAIVGIYMIILFGYMGTFSSAVADAKTIRLYRDILLIVMGFQYIIILFMAIRALGFDIKKFDFNRDAQELNATDSDSEEIEINTQIDTTNIVRGINKTHRELGYYIKEFRIYVAVILGVVLIILGVKAYNFFNAKLKVYGEEEYIGKTNMVKITDSYYTVNNNKNYVVVKFDAYKMGKRELLNINAMVLQIGRDKYIPDKTICSRFNTLGNCYKQQLLNSKPTSYIITYEVDKFKNKKTYLVYNDSYDNAFKVKLNMQEAK